MVYKGSDGDVGLVSYTNILVSDGALDRWS